MKKVVIAILLVLSFMVTSTVVAEMDLSGMTFAELIALKEQINLAMWNCDEWQEVFVPQGVYEVGVDIPAGKWTIEPADMIAQLLWGTQLENNGTTCSTDIAFDVITSRDYNRFRPTKDITHVDYDLAEGQYICIRGYSVVFKPFTGRNLEFEFK